MESKKFKTKFMGGFDKKDVMQYISDLQKSQAQSVDEQLTQKIAELKKENEILMEALEKANEHIKKLSDPITGSSKMVASSISHSKSHFENMAILADGIGETTNDGLISISKEVKSLLEKTGKVAKDFDDSMSQLRKNLEKFESHIAKSTEYFNDSVKENSKIKNKVKNENESIETLLSQGYELLDETTVKQLEISRLLDELKNKYE
ncbi:MAG: hypothetical protein IIX39_04010 [Clostridia bacterium]|nr:hypothetical protein [Clostridia bacterium]